MPHHRHRLSLRQTAAGLFCALSLAACATRGDVDALESQLRQLELAQEDVAAQLVQAREVLKVAQRDSEALRKQLTEHRLVALSPEQADVFYRAEAIRFNMFMTSGQDRDGFPGDEGLSVLLTPVDAHGDLVKLAGDVDLDLFDMTRPTDQQRLGQWKFTLDEVRQRWHKGFLSAGYLFQVDWQTRPVSPELTLHARMTVADGRQFDATTQVKVAPAGRSPPAIARESAAAATSPQSPGALPDRNVTPAAGRARVRLGNPASDRSGAESPQPPRIRPATGAGHAAPPTRTSDRWTEESIPTLR
jgi:hypothetical protein